jgi:DNA-binding response OmpR family regulator
MSRSHLAGEREKAITVEVLADSDSGCLDIAAVRCSDVAQLEGTMGNPVRAESVVRFHDFQANLETGEVCKAGVRLKLQDQPFKVLSALLQRHGQIVTREELRQLIWPDASFGDFDHAINLAIAKLRATLGDSADVPHLIDVMPLIEPGLGRIPPSSSFRDKGHS